VPGLYQGPGCAGHPERPCGEADVTKTVTLTHTQTRTTTVVKRLTPPPLILVPNQSRDLVYKPDLIGIGASSEIKNIRWSGYGRNIALGRGLFPEDTCDPNFAEGKVTWLPVVIRLKQRTLCQNHLAYALMAVKGSGFDNQFSTVGDVIGATAEAC
jgi:hypothetical protein